MTQQKHPTQALQLVTANLTIDDYTGSAEGEADDVQKTYG